MMSEERLGELVARVITRLAERLGATGAEGSLVIVVTAATVEFGQAVQQVRNLVLDGYRVQLAFSEAARELLSKAIMDQLRGFPHITLLEASHWLGPLREARAVVVPLLSLNTLSKVSLLIADNLATNLIVHGLLMGKPLVVAQNGVDPSAAGRQELGFHRGRSILAQAMRQRLRVVAQYGCTVTDVSELGSTVKSLLLCQEASKEGGGNLARGPFPPTGDRARRFITAAEVLQAWRLGEPLSLGPTAAMTPLARELALRHGVSVSRKILEQGNTV